MKSLLALLLTLVPCLAHAQAVEGCAVEMTGQISLPEVSFDAPTSSAHAYVEVECEAGLAYQLEVSNAAPGGVIELVSANPAPIPVQLRQAHSNVPWGAFQHGEAIGGVGTGERTSHPVQMGISLDAMPAPGVYRGGLEINLVF